MTQATFEKCRETMIEDIGDSHKWIECEKVMAALKAAESFQDLKKAIEDFWGWEDEQTVWLLEKILNEL